jgi:hypothetical protein
VPMWCLPEHHRIHQSRPRRRKSLTVPYTWRIYASISL